MARFSTALLLLVVIGILITGIRCSGQDDQENSQENVEEEQEDSRHHHGEGDSRPAGDDRGKDGSSEEDDDDDHEKHGHRAAVVGMFVACGICVIAVTFIITICIIKRMKLKKARVMSTVKLNIYARPTTPVAPASDEKDGPLPPPYVTSPGALPANNPPQYLAVDISKMEMPPPYEKVPDTGFYDKKSFVNVPAVYP